MSFAQQLEQKIRVDKLCRNVAGTLGASGSGAKIDKPSMRELLTYSQASLRHERDLELYLWPTAGGKSDILVLDNEIAIFADTTVEEVCIRKSPLIKEMFFNVVKILYNGKNVVRSRRKDTLTAVREKCLGLMDLSFDQRDIDGIRQEAARALDDLDSDGVHKAVKLFSELLEYEDTPLSLGSPDVIAKGALLYDEKGKILFGPSVLYQSQANRLVWVEEQMNLQEKENRETLLSAALRNKPVKAQGEAVFTILADKVAEKFHLAEGARADLKTREK